MLIAFLLHAYQPPQQNASVFSDIAKQCYLPLIKLAKSKKDFNFTFNIPLSTLEWFEKEKMEGFFYDVKSLYEADRVEFTGSGAYHPILTKIPADEVCRQIVLNEAGLSYYLGRREGFEGEPSLMIKNVKGFFPPEMAFNVDVAKVLDGLSYEWVVLDEVHKRNACHPAPMSCHPALDAGSMSEKPGSRIESGMTVPSTIPANLPVIPTSSVIPANAGIQLAESAADYELDSRLHGNDPARRDGNDNTGGENGKENHINKISETEIFAVFRNRSLSVGLSYNRSSDPSEFLEGIKHLESTGAKYAIIALDAETFGHHNKQGIELLGNIIDECVFSGHKFATVSDLVDEFKTKKSVEIAEASWGASDADVKSGNLYPVWYVAGNSYHEAFSNLEKLAVEMASKGGESLVGKEALFGNLPVWDFNKVSLAAELSEEEKSYIKSRILVDKSLNSDKYWWSSKNPYFDVNMIKRSLELFIKSYEKSGKKDEAIVVEIKKERDKILSLLKSE